MTWKSPSESGVALSAVLPPLIFGTATFNSQYNPDPYALPTTDLVHEALKRGVRAFDTSPYYGPSEELLGRALDTDFVRVNLRREDIFLLTKCGRISAHEFDYSPAWVRKSVDRSLQRLRTSYLDAVYCHDVEFVSADETLAAVRELRRIRNDEGKVRNVGISGYPVSLLCERAEMILQATGEPLDIVMSYANFTLQNNRLLTEGLPRLQAARVPVVPNASVLGMGLLRRGGVPVGSMGDWHPAPDELRDAVAQASIYCDEHEEKLEKIAIRHGIESWLRDGAPVGTYGDPATAGVPNFISKEQEDVLTGNLRSKLGVSVIGVSTLDELDETLRVWHSILATHSATTPFPSQSPATSKAGAATPEQTRHREWGLARRAEVESHAAQISRILGPWHNYAWPSPDDAFIRKRNEREERLRGESAKPADCSRGIVSNAALLVCGRDHQQQSAMIDPPSGLVDAKL